MAKKSGKNTGQGVRWPSPIFSFSPFRSRSELLFAILEARRLDQTFSGILTGDATTTTAAAIRTSEKQEV